MEQSKHQRYLFSGVLILLLAFASTFSSITQANWLSRWVTADTYTQTKYPIGLVHGMMGFDDILGIDYFHRIQGELSRSGAEVFTASISALNSNEARGEQLARQIEDILAITGQPKVNLFGHSQGALTARYVGSIYPDMVASITSIGGPNNGSVLADLYVGATSIIPFGDILANSIITAFGQFIDFLSGGSNPQSASKAFEALTTKAMSEFNQLYPEGIPNHSCGSGDELAANGVRYYSWSGSSPVTRLTDPFDYFLGATSLAFLGGKNDGLVSSCSSHLGKVIRDDYPMNHMDEVNQLFGIHSFRGTDPVTLYRQQANRLKNLGL